MEIDKDNFIPTELRMPGIKNYIHDSVGKLIENDGFKFKKSDFSFIKKQGKNYEQIMFLFYDYFPLSYSFEFLVYVFNETIENIKLKLPPQNHYEPFNRFSLFIRTNDFTNHINANDLFKTGYDYTCIKLDDLVNIGNAVSKTFREDVLPLVMVLNTVDEIDRYFEKKGDSWAVKTGFLNNICSDFISAKLAGRRNYHSVYGNIVSNIRSSPNPNYQTLTVIENLYKYLNSM